MKKFVLIIMFMSFFLFGYSQEKADTCFTKQEIIGLANTIKELKHRDSINLSIISELEKREKYYIEELERQKKLLDLERELHGLTSKEVNIYKEYAESLRPKWYDNKFLWFTVGVLSTTVVVWGTSEVIK